MKKRHVVDFPVPTVLRCRTWLACLVGIAVGAGVRAVHQVRERLAFPGDFATPIM